jgi:oxazoline/thiazoline dehydrogenase
VSTGSAASAQGRDSRPDRVAYRLATAVRVTEHEGEQWLIGDGKVWRIPTVFLPAAGLLGEWRTERELCVDLEFDRQVCILAAVRRLAGLGYLDQELRDAEERPLIRVQQVGGTLLKDLRAVHEPVGISRLAVMRVDAGTLIVERPGEHVVLSCPDARVRTMLMRLVGESDAARVDDTGLDAEDVGLIVSALAEAGIALPRGTAAGVPEAEDPRLRPWKWHDLAVHFRSRRGRHRSPAHATYHLLHQQPPEPAVKPPMSTRVIDLPIHDIEALRATDMTLTEAVEQRFSGREHDERPLDLNQLSELLFRAARVRWLAARTDETLYDHSSRPYPSGGATYDLEFYLTVDRCDGLEPGLYHYDPDRHALEHLDHLTAATGQMLLDATRATGGQVRPQVLLTVASRFARISWKYEGIAYATTLRNVGVFYQTLWLIATAMGIACCPLGGGDTNAFAEATGLDPYLESNVGEVTLGRLAPAAQRGNQSPNSRPGAWAERS